MRGNRELIAGVLRDAQFGPVVMLGVGGVIAEAVADVAFRLVPLSALALEVLAACPRGVGGYVFTTTGKRAVSGWSKAKALLDREIACERGGEALAPWVLHDLRRSVASGLVALGVRPDVVEAVLGHAHPGGSRLASVYQRHRYLPEMRDALDHWARHLNSLLGPTPAARVPELRRLA